MPHMSCTQTAAMIVIGGLAVTACSGPARTPAATPTSAATGGGTYAPHIDPAAFTTTVTNPYLPLRPGMRWVYRTKTDEGIQRTIVEVFATPRRVMGVATLVVRDTVMQGTSMLEDTIDLYAQDRQGAVWYFGEQTKEYRKGKPPSTKGSWEAGVDGAEPGIVMPARPEVGPPYRQEYYRGNAEDMAQVTATGAKVTVPTGSYAAVVVTQEFTPLEPDLLESKYYAQGIGMVRAVDLRGGSDVTDLVEFTP